MSIQTQFSKISQKSFYYFLKAYKFDLLNLTFSLVVILIALVIVFILFLSLFFSLMLSFLFLLIQETLILYSLIITVNNYSFVKKITTSFLYSKSFYIIKSFINEN
jgi:uncharacterized RDD family membrane protein YckC